MKILLAILIVAVAVYVYQLTPVQLEPYEACILEYLNDDFDMNSAKSACNFIQL